MSENVKMKRDIEINGTMDEKMSEIVDKKINDDEINDEEMIGDESVDIAMDDKKIVDNEMVDEIVNKIVNKKILVLDLDETLIYATEDNNNVERELYDFKIEFPVEMYTKATVYYVYKRPYFDQFIKQVAIMYRLVIWTAAEKEYAQPVIQQLFSTTNIKPEFIFHAYHCTRRYNNMNYEMDTGDRCMTVKNLRKVKTKFKIPLSRILIVDDMARNCVDNYGNAIIIPGYTGKSKDTALLDLITYLKYLSNVPDVRTINKTNWRNYNKDSESNSFSGKLV